jgi:hypothetical protein
VRKPNYASLILAIGISISITGTTEKSGIAGFNYKAMRQKKLKMNNLAVVIEK